MADPYVIIDLLGPPRAKGRHRSRIGFSRGRPFVMNYPDPDTERYEAGLAKAARVAMMGKAVLDEALIIDVRIARPIPSSFTKSQRQAALDMRLMPTPKPDLDNHGKVTDALNGIVWRDDALIVYSTHFKFYSEQPQICVKVWRWANE